MSEYRLYRVLRNAEGKHVGNEYMGKLVTCKECKHWQTDWNPEEGVDNFHFCPMVDGSRFDDFFCADGERRE